MTCRKRNSADRTEEHEALVDAIRLAASRRPGCDFAKLTNWHGATDRGSRISAGMTRGAADLIGHVFGLRVDIEIKTGEAEQTEAQRAWQHRILCYPELTAWGNVQRIMIRRNDGGADITWVEKQRIKDELAGPEAQAIEVFPPRATACATRKGDERFSPTRVATLQRERVLRPMYLVRRAHPQRGSDRVAPGSGPHLRANCATCGVYIKFVAAVEPWLSMTGAKP